MARDVNYEIIETDDDLTEQPSTSRSVLEDQLANVTGKPHGKFYRIASYQKNSAASSAAKALRDRHGSTEQVEGWTVRTRRDDDGRHGLWVRYNPDAVNENVSNAFKAARAAAKAGSEAKTPREKTTSAGENTGSAEQAQAAKAPEKVQQKAS